MIRELYYRRCKGVHVALDVDANWMFINGAGCLYEENHGG